MNVSGQLPNVGVMITKDSVTVPSSWVKQVCCWLCMCAPYTPENQSSNVVHSELAPGKGGEEAAPVMHADPNMLSEPEAVTLCEQTENAQSVENQSSNVVHSELAPGEGGEEAAPAMHADPNMLSEPEAVTLCQQIENAQSVTEVLQRFKNWSQTKSIRVVNRENRSPERLEREVRSGRSVFMMVTYAQGHFASYPPNTVQKQALRIIAECSLNSDQFSSSLNSRIRDFLA